MAQLVEADVDVVAGLRDKLLSPDTELPAKYRVMYSLRNVAGEEANNALLAALADRSALFRHDVAFCLGQRQDATALDALARKLHDTSEHPMVRHEAGEALGAIGSEESLTHLRQHLDDDVLEVAETCQMALQRIEYLAANPDASNEESPYYSVDPAPALPSSTPTPQLKAQLLDESQRMFDRYSALFALRNKGGTEAVLALGAVFDTCRSALLKHEVAYVLGQMQDQEASAILTRVLKNTKEHAMVRHEAAESLGAIADGKTVALLKEFCADSEPIVADSCVVALDMLEFEMSGAFQYADLGQEEAGAVPGATATEPAAAQA